MKKYRQPGGFVAVLMVIFALALGPGLTGVAVAASEDVAMFYDDLSQYGQWVEYGNYGPVWRPGQVPEDWRPYTNGRWVPTNDGNVFETQEPWGWATYHYGNWMPTENGWVWVPGSTWYPSTVEWRSSPENAPVDDSYIGWAPTPPPDYVPPQGYAPPSYYQGSPVVDALTAPLWIFAKAASFLLGFGQPYAPEYSYVSSGVLVPPAYVPVFYGQTLFIPRYVTPAYYPPGYLGVPRFGVGAYNMGPSVAYISRVTNINQTIINRNMNNIHINRIHNVMPPDRVMRRDAFIRNTLPPNLIHGRPLPPPRPMNNVRMAQVNLNKPNFLPPPKGVPQINAQIPRVQPVAFSPGRGLPGTALPAGATMALTPHMTQQIQQLPPNQKFVPGTAQPFKPVAATPAGPGPGQPGSRPQPGQFQPGVQAKPGGPGQAVVPGQPGHGPAQPGAQTRPGQFQPGVHPQPGTAPQQPQSPRALTPEQRRQQDLERQRQQRGPTPGQPQSQQQRDQERLRQQQLQQQQRQQQERQRQMQMQQQRQQQERQRQMQSQQQRQQQERQRQIKMQQRQQQDRQRQMQQQQQRQPQQQQRQQQIQQPRQQQQRQPQQRQQRQEREKKTQEHQ